MAAFKIGKDLLKVKSCWGPQQSIDYFPPVCIWVVALFKGVDIRVENGRGVIYRRIDYAVMLRRGAASGNSAGRVALGLGVLRIFHANKAG